MVAYRALYGDNKLWARPYDMFLDEVNKNGQQYRFLNFYKNFPQIVDALSRQSGMLLSWHIIELYYKFLINKLEIGMKKKHLSKLGVQEHYKEILILNIIIAF